MEAGEMEGGCWSVSGSVSMHNTVSLICTLTVYPFKTVRQRQNLSCDPGLFLLLLASKRRIQFLLHKLELCISSVIFI